MAAVAAQLAARQGRRVGWKLGMGERERIAGELVVGNLSTATRLEPGGTYVVPANTRLHADAEVAVEIGDDEQISGYAAALELVDLDHAPGCAEDIVATNIFHRAFALGSTCPDVPRGLQGRLLVNGEVQAVGDASAELAQRIGTAARILHAVGERLEPGDRVITGSVVQIAVQGGDLVVADFGPLGSVALELA